MSCYNNNIPSHHERGYILSLWKTCKGHAFVTVTTVSIQRSWPLTGSGEFGIILFEFTPYVSQNLFLRSGSSSCDKGDFMPEPYLPLSSRPKWNEMAMIPGITFSVTRALVTISPIFDLTLILSPSLIP